MGNTTKKPRYVKTLIHFSDDSSVPVYAGVRVANAFREVTFDMNMYKGVKLMELLEAVYQQGKKDGARSVSEGFGNMMKQIPHKNPGQPKKRRK